MKANQEIVRKIHNLYNSQEFNNLITQLNGIKDSQSAELKDKLKENGDIHNAYDAFRAKAMKLLQGQQEKEKYFLTYQEVIAHTQKIFNQKQSKIRKSARNAKEIFEYNKLLFIAIPFAPVTGLIGAGLVYTIFREHTTLLTAKLTMTQFHKIRFTADIIGMPLWIFSFMVRLIASSAIAKSKQELIEAITANFERALNVVDKTIMRTLRSLPIFNEFYVAFKDVPAFPTGNNVNRFIDALLLIAIGSIPIISTIILITAFNQLNKKYIKNEKNAAKLLQKNELANKLTALEAKESSTFNNIFKNSVKKINEKINDEKKDKFELKTVTDLGELITELKLSVGIEAMPQETAKENDSQQTTSNPSPGEGNGDSNANEHNKDENNTKLKDIGKYAKIKNLPKEQRDKLLYFLNTTQNLLKLTTKLSEYQTCNNGKDINPNDTIEAAKEAYINIDKLLNFKVKNSKIEKDQLLPASERLKLQNISASLKKIAKAKSDSTFLEKHKHSLAISTALLGAAASYAILHCPAIAPFINVSGSLLLGGTVHVATIAPLFATSLFTHYGKLLTEDMPDLTAFFKNTQKGVEKLVATFYEPRFQEFMLLAAIITMLSLSSMVIFKITEKLIDKKNGKSLNDLLGEPKTAKEIANLVTEFSPVAEKFQKQGISKQHLKRVHIN